MYNGAINISTTRVTGTFTWGGETYSGAINVSSPTFTGNFVTGMDPTVLARILNLENLKPFELLEDVVLGDLETIGMPLNNPNKIGIIQQIDETDGGRVYYPNFTTTPNGRSAIFTSVLTQLQNKIIIWPKE